MSEFKRGLSGDVMEKLKKEPLFRDKLLPDIKKGEVFPAIRDGYVSFYYKGGGIFEYDHKVTGAFTTHIKYAVIPEVKKGGEYVSEKELENVKICRAFIDGYKDIKIRCEGYGTKEAERVSYLYCFSEKSERADKNVILLDTEIALVDDEKNQNRIDLLFYDKTKRKLCFCEAKMADNNGFHENAKGIAPKKLKVAEQIERYNRIIGEDREDILAAYQAYVEMFNKLFETNLPVPTSCHEETGLLIFDDGYKDERKYKHLFESGERLAGIKHCIIGRLDDMTPEIIYNAIIKD